VSHNVLFDHEDFPCIELNLFVIRPSLYPPRHGSGIGFDDMVIQPTDKLGGMKKMVKINIRKVFQLN
jgi:hypothetical protein